MKIRTGFVSNSSSSSFTVTMEKSVYDARLAEVNDYIKEIMEHNVSDGEQFLDKTVVTISNSCDMGGGSPLDYYHITVDIPFAEQGDDNYTQLMDYTGEDNDGEPISYTPRYAFDTFVDGINKSDKLCISTDF